MRVAAGGAAASVGQASGAGCLKSAPKLCGYSTRVVNEIEKAKERTERGDEEGSAEWSGQTNTR